MSQTITDLIQELDESRSKFNQIIQESDINKMVYPEGGWRARDIMSNILHWESEAAKSLNAFADGTEYFVPNFFENQTETNKQIFERFKDINYSELENKFEEGRAKLIAALQRFSDEDLSKEHVAFFGGKAKISQLILDLVSHEQAHLDDIIKANSN